ncbi:nuclear protein [Modicella reniformis]|uniref:Non-structural maintenance of chromosomes element 4 n=1 Tax=Modicella reniformis TaxID=1440133 RepID=A0A9P6MBK3_9FUNG|nr:nuclear protein [Modicella reniformis]
MMRQQHDDNEMDVDLDGERDQHEGRSSEDLEKERKKNETRKIRQEYRQLIMDSEISGTHEAALDAKFLVMSADLGLQKAKQLRMGQGGFDETEYISRLVSKMGGHNIDNDQQGMEWANIGRIAMKWTRKVPTMDFMLGPMSVEHKSRSIAQRQRIVRDPNAMRKPQELREEDIARQENETTKNVMQISDILEGCTDKVNLFELVINPESFGQTIENIFYLSFLVRDGKVSISEEDMDDPNRDQYDDGEEREPREGANIQPMVQLTEPPTAEDYQGGLLKKQMVMELDMAMWRHLIEVYDIRRTMIPTRQSKDNVEKGKWYG